MKILFTTAVSSPHAAKWINQLKDTGWDLHAFQPLVPFPDDTICPEAACGTYHLPYLPSVPRGVVGKRTLPITSTVYRASRYVKPLARTLQAANVVALAALIRRLQPDVIHSLGLNSYWHNMCWPVLQARQLLGGKFKAPWVYSSWGADLDGYARRSAQQRAEVERVLGACDYYISECQRDVRLARELGFRGQLVGCYPAFGGVPTTYHNSLRAKDPIAARKIVFLKGRDDPLVGRAMTAMKAFALCQEELKGYRIVIGQAYGKVIDEAAFLAATTDLDIQVLPFLAYETLLRILGTARVFMAITVNDGLPGTLIEAMSLGAFPIHSDLEPIREWITSGDNGLLTPPEDVQAVAVALKQALRDDVLVNRAAEANAKLINTRISVEVMRPKVIDLYERIVRREPFPQGG